MLVELSKSEITSIVIALRDSGLEFTNNSRLHRKFTEILDKASINDID